MNPEQLKIHRELEYLRAVGAAGPRRHKRRRKHDRWLKRQLRVVERRRKLDEVLASERGPR
jgi:hypothetical protein